MNNFIARKNTTFSWLKVELDHTLESVHKHLQQYSTDGDNNALHEAAQLLHQLRGILRMAESYGAALLAEEMEQTLAAICEQRIERPEDAFQLLVRALLALESYLERLQGGDKDLPLVLLPLLNDLRAARDDHLLTENALFQPDLNVVPPVTADHQTDIGADAAVALVKRLRPYYQAGLLAWYRDADDTRSLKQLGAVVKRLEQTAASPENRRLWWICAGLIEALTQRGLETGVTTKLLLGKADRQIKRLIDDNELAAPPPELLKNLLFYVARAQSDGPRVTELKQAFDLEQALPSPEKISQASADLTGPRKGMLQTIAETLKDGLLQVKGGIDTYMRSDSADAALLQPALEILKQTADTLSVLGVGKVRQLVMEQAELLADIARGRRSATETDMMGVAQALLHVETVLDHLDVYLGLESETTPADDNSTNTTDTAMEKFPLNGLPESEFRQVVNAAIRECRANLTEVKNNIMAFVTTAMKQRTLLEAPRLLEEVTGALRILSLDHAAELVDAIHRFVSKDLLGRQKRPSQKELDMFAEAVVGLEYYLEAVADNRPPFEPILAMPRRCLAGLGYVVTAPEGDTDIPVLDSAVAELPQTSTAKPSGQQPDYEHWTQLQVGDNNAAAEDQGESSNVVALPVEDIDEEVIEIFVEEANEALSKLHEQLRALEIGGRNDATLNLIRHAFHTLKGSGRIAGAYAISDFAKAFEDFVNDIVCGVVAADEATLTLLQKTYPVLDELIANFGEGRSAPREASALAEEARNLRNRASASIETMSPRSDEQDDKDRPLSADDFDLDALSWNFEEALAAEDETSDTVPDDADEESDEEIGTPGPIQREGSAQAPDLLDSFISEALAGLENIRHFIDQCQEKPDSHLVPSSLGHTIYAIRMNARTLGISDIAELGQLLEDYIKKIGNQAVATPDTLEILAEFCDMTAQILAGLRERESRGGDNDDTQNHVANEESSAEDMQEHAPPGLAEADDADTDTDSDTDTAAADAVVDQIPSAPTPDDGALADEEITVIDIFFEEASELLEAIEEILQEWPDNAHQTDTLEALQRALHTIKGSARMAGITPVADLSHALESLTEAALSGVVDISTEVAELVRRAIDNLTEMMEQLRDNAIPYLADDVLSAIDALLVIDDEKNAPTEKTEPSLEVAYNKTVLDEEKPPAPPREEEPSVETETPFEAVETEPEEFSAPEMADDEQVSYDFDEAEPPVTARQAPGKKTETVRIGADVVDSLVSYANEESILNTRVEEQLSAFKAHLKEMENTLERLHGQLRDFESETDNEGLFFAPQSPGGDDGFDPLELDRFSESERLAKGLTESLGDLANLQDALLRVTGDTETILQQKGKIHKELQEGLISSRMVPFAKQAQRLQRIVRQTASELQKQASLHLQGTEGKLDRALLERIMGPLEHIMRNAIAHGIEPAEVRQKRGKPAYGNITISLTKDGSENVLRISDDGAGIDLEAVRAKAVEKNLIGPNALLSDDEVLHLILEPGFSTAKEVTQVSGRGIGMDVVNSEIQQLGGTLFVNTEAGRGTTFTMRLPFTMAMNRSLLVGVGENIYAIPSVNIDSVEQVDRATLEELYQDDANFNWQGQPYSFRYLGALLDIGQPTLPREGKTVPLVLIRSNEYRLALHVDELLGSREIIVKSTGPQLNTVRGISGATVLGDGRVVLILDVGALLRASASKSNASLQSGEATGDSSRPLNILVVDDSITVRKVTDRFLSRHNMSVTPVKDGMEAIQYLEEHTPDIILLDIEMPRMDGFEVAAQVRKDPRWTKIPIIMITSRTGRKHKEHALKIGVDRFLGKPYQENELLNHIHALTGTTR